MAGQKPGRLSLFEMGLIFVACAFPIHLWAYYDLLDALPSWTIRLKAWDIIGVVSYPLAFALFESLVVTIPLVVVGYVLIRRLPAQNVIALNAIWIWLLSLWAIAFQYFFEIIQKWGMLRLLALLVPIGITLALAAVAILRSAKLARLLYAVVDRLAVLVAIYVGLDLLGVLVIIIRNL